MIFLVRDFFQNLVQRTNRYEMRLFNEADFDKDDYEKNLYRILDKQVSKYINSRQRTNSKLNWIFRKCSIVYIVKIIIFFTVG